VTSFLNCRRRRANNVIRGGVIVLSFEREIENLNCDDQTLGAALQTAPRHLNGRSGEWPVSWREHNENRAVEDHDLNIRMRSPTTSI
jgi:hypothetical protein